MRIPLPDTWTHMDPRDRLKRKYPGEGLADPRPEMARLGARDKPLRDAPAIRESKVRVREGKPRRIQNLGKPWPNAPLLKRLVRYPYRQHTASGRRTKIADPIPWDACRLETREPVSTALIELRAALKGGNPLRTEPAPRAGMPVIPSVDDWLTRDGQ
jgi:hypothetical protein